MPVADFNNTQGSITTLDNIGWTEMNRKAACGFVNDFRDVAGLGEWHAVDDEETAFSLGPKILDATNAKSAFNRASKLFYPRNAIFDLFEL